jgi:UDP-galactopyranose mutase
MRNFEYLVVGQGIAGTVLGFKLLQKKKSLLY